MKKRALAIVAAFAALAAVAASASSRAPSVAVPDAVKSREKGLGPLLAVVPGIRGPVLGRADKRAIWIARRSPRLRLHNNLRAWAYADGSAIAIATQPDSNEGAKVQFVQPRLITRLATTPLPSGSVAAVTWGDGRVDVVLGDSREIEVVSIDAETHRPSVSARIPGSILGIERVGGRLVLLTAPKQGIGTAGLAVVEPTGILRIVALSQIQAGSDTGEDGGQPDLSKLRQNIPGLAVDPDSGRAFVIPATGPIAEVHLATFAVSYHSLAQPVSLLGRVHDWIEPKAEAKGSNGPIRSARWLGNGVVAVSGGNETATPDASNQPHFTWSPAGLSLIDTNTWGTRVIDRGADSFEVVGDAILVTGSSWRDGDRIGMGFAVYGLDGTKRLSVLPGGAAYLDLAFRGKAYLNVGQQYVTKVVDLATGRVLKDRHAPLATLLIGDASS